MASIRELIQAGRARLEAAGISQPRREAALLLGHLLRMSESALLAHADDPVEEELASRFDRLTARRASREPVAYLTGFREFWGRRFEVDSRVLIPRPETEHLVELALSIPLPATARVLDVGTGSGVLAVTLAAERPSWSIWATDLSLAALAVADANARRHGVRDRLRLAASNLLAAISATDFDLIVSNPPYVDSRLRGELQPDVGAFEPPLALYAADRGLGTLADLLRQARTPRSGVWLACEIGSDQLEAVTLRASEIGGWALVESRPDLAGLDRVVLWKSSPGSD